MLNTSLRFDDVLLVAFGCDSQLAKQLQRFSSWDNCPLLSTGDVSINSRPERQQGTCYRYLILSALLVYHIVLRFTVLWAAGPEQAAGFEELETAAPGHIRNA